MGALRLFITLGVCVCVCVCVCDDVWLCVLDDVDIRGRAHSVNACTWICISQCVCVSMRLNSVFVTCETRVRRFALLSCCARFCGQRSIKKGNMRVCRSPAPHVDRRCGWLNCDMTADVLVSHVPCTGSCTRFLRRGLLFS